MDDMLTVIDDDRCTLKVEFCYGKAFIHATFRKKFAAMRIADMAMNYVKSRLRRMGYQKMHVIVSESNKLLCKFSVAMGFTEIHRGGGWVIMEQDNGRFS